MRHESDATKVRRNISNEITAVAVAGIFVALLLTAVAVWATQKHREEHGEWRVTTLASIHP